MCKTRKPGQNCDPRGTNLKPTEPSTNSPTLRGDKLKFIFWMWSGVAYSLLEGQFKR